MVPPVPLTVRDLRPEQRHRIVQYITLLLSIIACAIPALLASIPEPHTRKEPEPYHTSILTGEGWVVELLTGHPERIRNELGMHADVFSALIRVLRDYGHDNSRHVSLEEQLAIFLYTCVTGLPLKHVGERFQRSNDTISTYFRKMLFIFTTDPFYPTYSVIRPGFDIVASHFRSNPKFWPYFKDAVGAMDGTFIPIASPPANRASAFRNRKGFISQNCLFICDFNLRFTFALTGWEGSATDARVYSNAVSRGLTFPEHKYVLGDLGYPSRPTVLVPYRGVQYHLAEWGRANKRPVNKEELFNLRHASARNAIERSFGVLKNRFRILLLSLAFPIAVQSRIPAALAAVHNFIRTYETDETTWVSNDEGPNFDGSEDDDEHDRDNDEDPGEEEADEITELRDRIATQMWTDYLQVVHARGEN